MTHLYTILLGGNVIPDRDEPPVSAIAWAGDTVIGLGSDDEMRALSRGDSWFVELGGASVVPLGDGDPAWPVEATLEIGGQADLAVLATDPRDLHSGAWDRPVAIALVRGGRLVAGSLPGDDRNVHERQRQHAHRRERADTG